MGNFMNKGVKTYYIIGNYKKREGLFALYKHITSHIIYALEKNMIPVIDLKHFQNQYFKDDRAFKDNAWEYYFEQPAGIGLDDIEEDANIVIAEPNLWANNKYIINPIMIPVEKNYKKLPYTTEYLEYLKFKPDIKIYLDDCYTKNFKNSKNVLGVICRGSDYTELKPLKHQIQPNPKDVLNKAKELMTTSEYEKIYLATEDANIYKMFEEEFEDKLIKNIQYKFETVSHTQIASTRKSVRKNHFYELGKEYLCSMWLLSKCKGLIGGRANGTVAVYIMTNGFETFDYVHLWNLGVYGVDDVPYKRILKNIFEITNITKNGEEYKRINILGIKFHIAKQI